MELKYTPRTVKEIEDRAKRPITDVVGAFSVGNVSLLVEKGAGLANEGEALDAIEKAFEEGTDLMTLYLDILDVLKASGFLPKALDLAKIREQMNNPEALQAQVEASVVSG